VTPYEIRLANAESIVRRLAAPHHSTTAQSAAKQLNVLVGGAKRLKALGKEAAAVKALDWAAP